MPARGLFFFFPQLTWFGPSTRLLRDPWSISLACMFLLTKSLSPTFEGWGMISPPVF